MLRRHELQAAAVAAQALAAMAEGAAKRDLARNKARDAHRHSTNAAAFRALSDRLNIASTRARV